MMINWGSVTDFFPALLAGAELTIYISVSAFLLALVVASLVAGGRLASITPIRWTATAYVELIRNTPLLLQIYIVFYGLPSLGVRLSPVNASIVSLGLNVGAYLGEIFRAGALSVPRGQLEAATSLGIGKIQRLVYIIIPVSLRNIFPSMANMVLATILGSSLASVISVAELTGRTNDISARTFLTIEVYSVSAGIYIAIALGFSVMLALLQFWLFPRRSRI